MRRLITLALALTISPMLLADELQKVREGIALYDSGHIDEAIAKYKEVLAENPKSVAAAHELALAYATKNDFAACRATLEPVVDIGSPAQIESLTLLGNCLDSGGNRKKAVETYRRALKLKPDDPRVIVLNVDPDARKEEGDYTGLAIGVATAAATRFTEEDAKKSEFERSRAEIAAILSMFIEMAEPGQSDYTALSHLPFFQAMSKAKLIDTFAGVALSTQKLDGGDAWAKKNQAELQRYMKWVEPYRNPRALIEMPVPQP